jgi:hypothetical protein
MFTVIEVTDGSVTQVLPLSDLSEALSLAEGMAEENDYEKVADEMEWFDPEDPRGYYVCVFDVVGQEVVKQEDED